MATSFRVIRVKEQGGIIIYQRCWKEAGIPKYFAHSKSQDLNIKEFRDIRQVKAYLKTI